jgi:acyl-CoA synthetase (NDP forming)
MPVRSLLNPRSIAIVGASEKIGPGSNAFKALTFAGYEGDIFLVNPRAPELFGRQTYASLDDIPGRVDAVFVAVQAELVLDVAQQAARKGAGALAILSSGFGETESGKDAQQRLADICAAADIAVCGPNCLGLLNFVGKSALWGTSLPEQVTRGGIAAIVQSGSIGIALLNSVRGLGFSHLITTGNEAVTTASDYIEAVIDDPQVTTILVFAEQIKKPAAFLSALRRAHQAGKPVIVLKSGRSQSGKAAVMAHTGAVAGSDEACDAALLAANAIQVHTLDELIETALLAAAIKTPPTGRGLGGVSLSGGEIALVLDAAEELGLDFAPLTAALPTIKELLPPFAHLANPLDLTWAGLYDPAVGQGCAEAIARQSDVDMMLLLQDAPSGLGKQQADRYANLLASISRGAVAAGKPLVALSNLSDQPHSALQAAADKAGVPYLRGTRTALSAIGRYLAWAAARPETPSGTPAAARSAAATELAAASADRLPAEHEARQVLTHYGVTGPDERFVASVEEAAAAAAEIGFPVVLKGLAENVLHKSDAGLVKVGLTSQAEVRAAATAMEKSISALPQARRLGFLVQRKVVAVSEIFVGARVDPDFGPIVVVGAGGVQVELYKDVAVRLAPISEASARQALESTKVIKLLEGFRGAPVGDIDAVARTVSAVSRFIADFADELSEVEINPLGVMPKGQGCIALDCVIVPRQSKVGHI